MYDINGGLVTVSTTTLAVYIAISISYSIWLDNVHCTGQEESLLLCHHSNIGESDCNHYEDVLVKCNQLGEDVAVLSAARVL